MKIGSSEDTTVVEVYGTRHDAEIAKSFLADQGIDSFVLADDVHVVLQSTEGARLVVMQSESQRAYDALADADLLSDSRVSDGQDIDVAAEAEAIPATNQNWRLLIGTATLVLFLLLILLWRMAA